MKKKKVSPRIFSRDAYPSARVLAGEMWPPRVSDSSLHFHRSLKKSHGHVMLWHPGEEATEMRGDGPSSHGRQTSKAQKTWRGLKGPTLTRGQAPSKAQPLERETRPPPATGKGGRWGAPRSPQRWGSFTRCTGGQCSSCVLTREKEKPSSSGGQRGLSAQAVRVLVCTSGSRRAGSR